MKIKLYLDNNVWDVFYEMDLDIKEEIGDVFELVITREAELEIESMPDPLKSYVVKVLSDSNVKTDLVFGFFDSNKPKEKQSVGGFSCKFDKSRLGGRFARKDETEFVKNEKIQLGKLKKTGLYLNEADKSLASRAVHSAILTRDRKKMLKRAAQRTSNVVNLTNWDQAQPPGQDREHFSNNNLSI